VNDEGNTYIELSGEYEGLSLSGKTSWSPVPSLEAKKEVARAMMRDQLMRNCIHFDGLSGDFASINQSIKEYNAIVVAAGFPAEGKHAYLDTLGTYADKLSLTDISYVNVAANTLPKFDSVLPAYCTHIRTSLTEEYFKIENPHEITNIMRC